LSDADAASWTALLMEAGSDLSDDERVEVLFAACEAALHGGDRAAARVWCDQARSQRDRSPVWDERLRDLADRVDSGLAGHSPA
jgi:hypothetical protein